MEKYLAKKKGLKRSVILQDASSITLLFNNKLYKSMKKISKPPTFNRMFANRRMKIFVGSLMLLVFSSVFYVQCAKELPIPNTRGILASNGTIPILRMSYDSEVSTYMTTDGDLTNTMDIAAQTPTIEKNNIVIEIAANGEVTLQMIKRTPSQTIEIPHLTLPYDSPQPYKTIIGGGKVQIFDDGNTLIHSEDFVLPNAIEVVNLLQSLGEDFTSSAINDMLSMGQSSLFISNLQTYLQQAASNGITVNHLNNDFVTLSQPIDPQNSSSDISVSLINKTSNQMVENRLYDANNNWKSSIQFRYHDGEFPTIKEVLERTKTMLPSGLNCSY
jgi:hypothetical protein